MPPPANEAKDLNLTVTEPPLKKLKRQIEKMSAVSESQTILITELSPASLKVQLQEDDNLISGELIYIVRTSFIYHLTLYLFAPFQESPKESTLDKWRKSFQSTSVSSLSQVINPPSLDEFDLLSNGFFSDPIDPKEQPTLALEQDDEFDFGSDVFSNIEDEFASFSLSKYESVTRLDIACN